MGAIIRYLFLTKKGVQPGKSRKLDVIIDIVLLVPRKSKLHVTGTNTNLQAEVRSLCMS